TVMRQRHVTEREHAWDRRTIGDEEDPDLPAARVIRAHRDGPVRHDDPDREIPAGIRRLRAGEPACCRPEKRRERDEQEHERPQPDEGSTALWTGPGAGCAKVARRCR